MLIFLSNCITMKGFCMKNYLNNYYNTCKFQLYLYPLLGSFIYNCASDLMRFSYVLYAETNL